MRILFVYTDINTMGFGSRSYHFGIGILSAMLKRHNHQTSLYCMQGSYKIGPLIRKITRFKPDLLAFTSDSTQFIYIKKILKGIKHLKIFSILGGAHVSLRPQCLSETDGLNAICKGEGEYALLELVDALENKKDFHHILSLDFKDDNSSIVKNPTRPFITDLDSLPFSDRDIFDYQKVVDSEFGRASFMLSRGCPYSCTYCASPAMGRLQEGRYVRFMSVERAIAELVYLKEKYRFKSIFFADDTFTISKNYVYEFCEEYKKKIDIPFELNARVESAGFDLFKALREAGCFKVHMGIESGDEKFRKDVLNRKMSNEQIVNAFDCAKKAGLLVKSYNIVGFPFETEQICRATVDLNQRILPDGHVCYIFQPYPGTKLYEVCKKEGFVDKKLFQKEVMSRRDTVLKMPFFTRRQIIKCHRNFSFEVYKKHSLRRAFFYRLYYSRYGELLIRIFSPFKNYLRSFAIR